MSKDPYRDQAAKLKQKIERVPEKASIKKREPLPARSEVHREKKKKNKWRMKYPLISMLLLFFILLPLTVFSIYSYFDSRNGPLVVMSEDVDDVEEVRYDQSDNDNEESIGEADSKEEEAGNDKSEESLNEVSPSMTGKEQPASTEPASPSPEQESAEEKPKEEVNDEPVEDQPTNKIVYHTVAPKETLYRIAMKYYNSQSGVERIKEWNNIQNNEIQSGQVLEIPLD